MLPAVAAADTINFLGLNRGSQVSLTWDDPNSSATRSGTFWAGELGWYFSGGTPEGFATNFYSYCVDVAQNLGSPQTVTPRSTTGFTNGAADGGARAAWLFNTYASNIHASTDSTAGIQAAALQVAIWEAMYDTGANLAEGSFILNTTGTVRTQAQAYLNSLYGAGGGGYFTSVATILEVISPNRGQDQIVSRVNEPSTLLLMGLAFLVFARRTRRGPGTASRA
jgi:hypothetical protein